MLKLYAFATPNNVKVAIALEELGAAYELHAVNIRGGEQRAASFLALNPNAKVPVLVDGDFVLTESAAILVYLAEKTGKLLPSEGHARAKVFEQLFFHASGISPAFGNAGFFQKLASEKIPFAIERFHGEAKRLMGLLDNLLSGSAYVAGEEYSIADIAHFGWLWRSAFVGIELADYPHVQAWYARILAREATQAGIKKIESLVPNS